MEKNGDLIVNLIKSILAATSFVVAISHAHAQPEIDFEALSKQYNGQRNWSVPEAGRFGLSMFTFQDFNGNGVYELEDKPLANIPVVLLDEHGTLIDIKKTNVDGYINFYGSTFEGTEETIKKPGKYTLRILTPEQFDLTTDSLAQTIEVVELEGSIGGLIAKNVPKISGFKRKLAIFGQTIAIDDHTIAATSPSGEKLAINVGREGRYSVPATQGAWALKYADRAAMLIDVDATPIQLSKTFGTESKQEVSSVTTVTFDDMVHDEGVLKIPNGYAGLNWDNWVITHKHFYKAEGYKNGAVSGDYVAYNSSGHPASISRSEPFDFVGGYFSVSFDSAEGEGFDVKAYRGDQLAYHDVIKLSRFGPVHFMADYRDITKLEFSTQHYWQGIADDLQFRLP